MRAGLQITIFLRALLAVTPSHNMAVAHLLKCESSREGHMQKIQLRIAKSLLFARSLCATFRHDAVTDSFLVFFSVQKNSCCMARFFLWSIRTPWPLDFFGYPRFHGQNFQFCLCDYRARRWTSRHRMIFVCTPFERGDLGAFFKLSNAGGGGCMYRLPHRTMNWRGRCRYRRLIA